MSLQGKLHAPACDLGSKYIAIVPSGRRTSSGSSRQQGIQCASHSLRHIVPCVSQDAALPKSAAVAAMRCDAMRCDAMQLQCGGTVGIARRVEVATSPGRGRDATHARLQRQTKKSASGYVWFLSTVNDVENGKRLASRQGRGCTALAASGVAAHAPRLHCFQGSSSAERQPEQQSRQDRRLQAIVALLWPLPSNSS
eukprot:6171848-Pleurochrysis_carterae.AAC.1